MWLYPPRCGYNSMLSLFVMAILCILYTPLMGDNGSSWKTQVYRQTVASKIDGAIKQSGISASRNGLEMENYIFQKTKTKKEYLTCVAKLILLHVRGMSNSKQSCVN